MRLLIHQAAYARLKSQIDALAPSLQALVMDDVGEVSLKGRAVRLEESPPELGWLNTDALMTPARRQFVGALTAAPELRWVQTAAAGLDHPMWSRVAATGARMSSSHGQAIGIAEYVLAGVLDHLQAGPARREAQAVRAWRRIPFREIMDSRWLVIGFGAIGQAVAERAGAFGAQVTGVRRNQAPHPAARVIAPLANVRRLTPEADVVVLCCPLNEDTRRLVNEDFLVAMKPGSILVNVGRGALVDEAALLSALDRGVPEHAVLDVFEQEPLPPDSPFWDHPRVSLSAHNSGNSEGHDRRNDRLFLDNLKRFLAGEPLAHEVDTAELLAAG